MRAVFFRIETDIILTNAKVGLHICILRDGRNMIFRDIYLDAKAIKERDPAAKSMLEVFLLYQGLHALIFHRFAHFFLQDETFLCCKMDFASRKIFYID